MTSFTHQLWLFVLSFIYSNIFLLPLGTAMCLPLQSAWARCFCFFFSFCHPLCVRACVCVHCAQGKSLTCSTVAVGRAAQLVILRALFPFQPGLHDIGKSIALFFGMRHC
uniref:Uncharacterized protein n=1 Tax=Trypanosoma vivax (strain Y486) TaxID=1055687 RepID=G0UCT2_TRYVY|nr:hypothetical protein TVY486_1111260 [Trypanosoma vivax Y486]